MTTKITTTARALRDLLTPVLALTDKGDTLPVLECIRLRGHRDGATLTAQATDRYVAGMSRASIETPAGFEALLPWRSAKALLGTFKVTRGHDPELVLTFDDDTVTVETAGLSEAIAGARLGFRLYTSREYPNIDEVLRDAFKGTGQPESNVSGALLASFTGALRDGHPIRLWHNGLHRPTGVAIGEHFRGCIMPVRIAAGKPGPLDDGWGELVGAPVKPAVEAVSA